MSTNPWPVSHTSSLPMEKARFLYALLHGDSINLPKFICHHILRTFRVPGHMIGLFYACLIHHLVISMGVTFLDGVSRCISWPIGQVTISQSRSHVPLSFAPTESVEPADLAVPADPICDTSSTGPSHIPASTSQPSILSDFPSSSTSVPPPSVESILGNSSIPIDPSVAPMGQTSVLIKQQARMMVEIT